MWQPSALLTSLVGGRQETLKKEGRVVMSLNLALGPDCGVGCSEVRETRVEKLTKTQHLYIRWLQDTLIFIPVFFSGCVSSSGVIRRRYVGFYRVYPCISRRLQYRWYHSLAPKQDLPWRGRGREAGSAPLITTCDCFSSVISAGGFIINCPFEGVSMLTLALSSKPHHV